MSARQWIYICDACGNVVTIEAAPIADDSGWECDQCGCNALWEFTDKQKALAHSRHIQDIVRSRLFRRVGKP